MPARAHGGARPDGPGPAETMAKAAKLADQVAVAAAGCPTVARLATGPLGTYLPARTIPGVSIDDHGVHVAVVARYGSRMTEIAEQVREAVRPLVGDRRIDVAIEDIEPPAPWVVWGIESRVR